jgi:hypothetical protein
MTLDDNIKQAIVAELARQETRRHPARSPGAWAFSFPDIT